MILYGWHTVKAALENPARRFRRLLATENAARRLAEERRRAADRAGDRAAGRDRGAGSGPMPCTRASMAEADPLPSPAIEELDAEGIVLVLDQITDPHNVGAILRSAAAFAVDGHRHHRAPQPGGDRRAGQGGLRRARTRAARHGAEPRARARRAEGARLPRGRPRLRGDSDLAAVPLRAPLALVLGAEGKGLRQLTRDTCDTSRGSTCPGAIKSLNVSNAAALALYVASGRLAAECSARQALQGGIAYEVNMNRTTSPPSGGEERTRPPRPRMQ